jgi:hypothetical protein
VHRFRVGDAERVDTTTIAAEADAVWLVRAPPEVVERLQPAQRTGRAGGAELVILER